MQNDEVKAVFLGREFTVEMKTMFSDDISHSEVVELNVCQRRSITLGMMGQLARMEAHWL